MSLSLPEFGKKTTARTTTRTVFTVEMSVSERVRHFRDFEHDLPVSSLLRMPALLLFASSRFGLGGCMMLCYISINHIIMIISGINNIIITYTYIMT